MPLSKIFHYILAVIFIGGGNQSTLGKPPTCHKSLTSHNVVSSTPHHERGSPHTTLVVVDTDCTGSCKSNDHTTTTAPGRLGIAVQLT